MRYPFVVFLLSLLAACNRPVSDQYIPPVPALGRDDNAQLLSVLTDLVDNYGRSPVARYQRARCYLALQKPINALDDINEAIRLDPNNPTYHYYRAVVCQQLGEDQQVWESARQAEKLNNQTVEFYVLMGGLYQARQQYGKARQYLDMAQVINPHNAELAYFQGNVAAAARDSVAAARWYAQSLQIDSQYVETYNRLAEMAQRTRGGAAQAWQYVRTGLRHDSTNATLYVNGGAALQALNLPDSARGYYERALRLQPGSYLASFRLGSLLLDREDYAGAQRYLETASQQASLLASLQKSDLPRLNYRLGLAYAGQGKLEGALAQFGRARAVDSTDANAREQYNRVSYLLDRRVDRLTRDSLYARQPTPIRRPRALVPLEPITPKGFGSRRDTVR